ncbi:MAG: ABC transporter [Legionellales bacterium RIFCSPHIGHO2_12_FULL_37_14]|nr:MAG: ABC transporter [Legionellales bacterium RIFCSPHIGHO2_12_FULL_37_14]
MAFFTIKPFASPPSFDAQDPYQSINRKVHNFNMAFDATFLKPPARLYTTVIPARVRAGINNIFTNIHMLPTMANDILQAEPMDTARDFWRFAINSTLGIGGIFDVAANPKGFNFPPHSNDLGLTFAKWGNKTSPYFVIPFLGPSTYRDGMGMIFDYTLFTPYPYMAYMVLYPAIGVRYVDLRSQLLDQETLMRQALDPYIFIRDAYLQHRQYLITGKEPNVGSIYLDEDNVLPTT